MMIEAGGLRVMRQWELLVDECTSSSHHWSQDISTKVHYVNVRTDLEGKLKLSYDEVQ